MKPNNEEILFLLAVDIPIWMKGMLFDTLKDCDKKDVIEMIKELQSKEKANAE